MLNRVVRRTPHGFEAEADLRHADLIVKQLGLGDCKTVSTAGVDVDVECAVWKEEPEEGSSCLPKLCVSGPSVRGETICSPISSTFSTRSRRFETDPTRLGNAEAHRAVSQWKNSRRMDARLANQNKCH